LKSVFLAVAVCLIAVPSLAENEEFAYKIMRSDLDTQLQNEGFDPAAIDLVHLVGGLAAQRKICGVGGMKDDLMELSAKEAHVPVNILIDKARAYMDLEVSRVRAIYNDLAFCRRLEDIRERAK
jgi:hypothetical protein